MKKYTITLNAEQMDFLKTAMQSQLEVSSDVVDDACKRLNECRTRARRAEYADSLRLLATAIEVDGLLAEAEEEPGSAAPEERKTPDDNVNVHRDKLAGIYDDVCAICTGYETGEDDKASDMYYRLVDVLDTMVKLGFDQF